MTTINLFFNLFFTQVFSGQKQMGSISRLSPWLHEGSNKDNVLLMKKKTTNIPKNQCVGFKWTALLAAFGLGTVFY